MEYFVTRRFAFASSALPSDTFGVVSFKGAEGISRCYQFDITLVSNNLEIDLTDVVQRTATLTFLRKDRPAVDYHGLVFRMEQLHEVGGIAFYRVLLAPKLHCLSFTWHNQVFLEKTVPEVISECLKDGGLTNLDFEFRLQGSYEPLDYVCQYRESHLDFISRWLEFEGLYYFFEQTDEGEKVILTDRRTVHTPLRHGDIIRYSPPSALEANHMDEVARSFNCGYTLTPASVMLKDYNYMRPSLDVIGSSPVDEKGRGKVYSYGEHVATPQEGNRIAKLRAEALLCRREVFQGESSVPAMTPGYTFTLQDHYRNTFNQTYLITRVDHEGNQAGYLLAGLTEDQGAGEKNVSYRNTFDAIVSSVQFRPAGKTERPRISGIIPAKIDAEGSGEYAEVDRQGRYKVILPFDTSGRRDGKASTWIRMATPYAGNGHGMHFPLHKGTEVLVAFVDGDPDRPVILGAVPNPETPSLVTTDNQTMSMIQTAGGNKIAMEDKSGSERILLHSPNKGSFVRIGAPNDPPPAGWQAEGDGTYGLALVSEGALSIQAQAQNSIILGESTETVAGGYAETVGGATVYTYLGGIMETTVGVALEFAGATVGYSTTDNEIKAVKNELTETRNQLGDVTNFVVNDHAEVVATKIAVANVNTRVNDVKTEVTEEYTTAIATESRIRSVESQLIVNSQRALAQRTDALGERVATLASDVTTVANRVDSVAQKTETLGDHVKTVATATHSIAEKTECTTEANQISGLLTLM